MSKLTKVTIYSMAAWLLTMALGFAIPIPPVAGLAGLASLLIGPTLLILAAVSLVIAEDKRLPLLAALLITLTTWLANTRAVDWGARLHFLLNRGQYEAKVSEVLAAGGAAEKEQACGGRCWLMSGENNRIAFHYAHGFLNWQDIVYDPTGAIMAQDWDAKKRIDMFLRRATHLSGDWYLVYFSD
jgi:hypothetical protein